MDRPVVPTDMTSDKLRAIAHWLDLHDQVAERFLLLVADLPGYRDHDVAGAIAAVRGTEVQDDLRRWADEIERSDL